MFLARVCRRPLRSFHGGLLVLSSKELCNLRFIAKSAVTLNGEGPKSVQHRDANSSRSVLEKVLIKEDEQPNTTAGKGKLLLGLYGVLFNIWLKWRICDHAQYVQNIHTIRFLLPCGFRIF